MTGQAGNDSTSIRNQPYRCTTRSVWKLVITPRAVVCFTSAHMHEFNYSDLIYSLYANTKDDVHWSYEASCIIMQYPTHNKTMTQCECCCFTRRPLLANYCSNANSCGCWLISPLGGHVQKSLRICKYERINKYHAKQPTNSCSPHFKRPYPTIDSLCKHNNPEPSETYGYSSAYMLLIS